MKTTRAALALLAALLLVHAARAQEFAILEGTYNPRTDFAYYEVELKLPGGAEPTEEELKRLVATLYKREVEMHSKKPKAMSVRVYLPGMDRNKAPHATARLNNPEGSGFTVQYHYKKK